jgi:hypothetical protein
MYYPLYWWARADNAPCPRAAERLASSPALERGRPVVRNIAFRTNFGSHDAAAEPTLIPLFRSHSVLWVDQVPYVKGFTTSVPKGLKCLVFLVATTKSLVTAMHATDMSANPI